MAYWPGGRRAAVSLTFDDGLESQLALAIPALDARGLRATFYLNPRGSEDGPQHQLGWRERLARWAPARAAGHEIGNHSLRHPCSLNNDVSSWAPNLLGWTIEQLEADVDEAQRRIEAAFPDQGRISFAYPCYETSVGRGEARVSSVPLVARRFAAGRARGERANDPRFCDLHHLSSWPVERCSGATMVGLVEQAAALGHWAILTFHGIAEGHLSVSEPDFAELLGHLARADLWVAPVAEVAAHVAAS